MAKRRANGEGSIFQRKDGLWAAQYTDNMGKKRTLYGKTQQIVKDKLKEALRQLDAGMAVGKDKMAFADWMKRWLDVYCKPTVRKSTYARAYNRVYGHIIPAFPKVTLKDLRPDMLQKFFNDKAEGGRLDTVTDPETGEKVQKPGGLSVAELHRLRQIIIQALNQAVDDRIIADNPALKVKLPKKERIEVHALTVDEQKKVESAALKNSNPLAFAIVLDLYTGLRVGELMGLKISDIDLKKKELTVRRTVGRVDVPGEHRTEILMSEPKTASGRRTIPLTDFIADMLKEYIQNRNTMVSAMRDRWSRNSPLGRYNRRVGDDGEWKDEGFLFLTLFGTIPENGYIRRLLDDCLKTVGLKHINFHALRHTFATRCVESGFDIKSLSEILGHTDASMTLNIYTHAMGEQKRRNMDKLKLLSTSENDG